MSGDENTLKKDDPARLVQSAMEGSPDARKRLYEIFSQRIFNFVLGMVHSREEAEDVLQDAFIHAFRSLSSLKDADRFDQWLYRIARNEVYQRFRKRKTEDVVILRGQEDCGQNLTSVDEGRNPEESVLSVELSGVVKRALDTLPPKMREVFVLSVIHQKSYKEIAEIVGRSLLAVKTDIYRARGFAKDTIAHYLKRG